MTSPTIEQESILNEKGACVVVARPGSGKTFTLAHKIKKILDDAPAYRGVIAISYTNKASDELKNRVLNLGVEKKSSFFGTIDKFCLTEIVIPFLRHQFNFLPQDINIVDNKSSKFLEKSKIDISKGISWDVVQEMYAHGEVVLDLAGRISVQLLKENKVLKEYLKARFTHIIIDEYQDSGKEQHEIFITLHNLGIIAIAVGDLDQSIYAFAGKSSEYLYALTQNAEFKKYALTKNHRCHPSISVYSLKFLNSEFKVEVPSEIRVYSKKVDGAMEEVVDWIEEAIPSLCKKFLNLKPSDIGVLARSNNSARAVRSYSKNYKFQLRDETPLDNFSSIRAVFVSQCLFCFFDKKSVFTDIFELHIENSKEKRKVKIILNDLIEIRKHYIESNTFENIRLKEVLIKCTDILFPESEKDNVDSALNDVLNSSDYIKSYYPVDDQSVQVMTLHKSKGLEFKVVFHLDLHQWIIPSYPAIKGSQKEMTQSLNLHYVGITRAKEACVLVTSTRRNDYRNKTIKDAQASDFLNRVDLLSLRKNL